MKRKQLRQAWAEGQLDNERGRMTVDGRRVDDHALCKLLVVQEIGGDWVLYPHGWGKFGVRLSKTDALTVAQAILDSAG